MRDFPDNIMSMGEDQQIELLSHKIIHTTLEDCRPFILLEDLAENGPIYLKVLTDPAFAKKLLQAADSKILSLS